MVSVKGETKSVKQKQIIRQHKILNEGKMLIKYALTLAHRRSAHYMHWIYY